VPEWIHRKPPGERCERVGEQVRTSRFSIAAVAFVVFALAGCNTRPRFAVGDHLIPLGSSDPTQIVTVVAVEKDSYRVSVGVTAGPPDTMQTRNRKEIDSYYVRVADLPVGGSWATPEKHTPTPSPAASRTPQPTATPSATPTPTPPPLDLAKLSASVRPAVVRLLIFDAADKQTRTATGFLISADGRLVTAAAMVEGAAKALLEMPSGAIKTVKGVLASSPQSDVAVLKADVTGVPFVPIPKAPRVEAGKQVVIVENKAVHGAEPVSGGTIEAVQSDPAGDVLQLAGAKLQGGAGSPVVDDHGEVIGLVTAATDDAPATARSIAALGPVLAQIHPKAAPAWPGQPSPSPSATPKPHPTASPAAQQGGDAAIVYSPYPRYPPSARYSYFGPQSGTGQFLIKFGSDGAAISTQVVKSTGSALLDEAALDTLKSWRAQRGRPSQKIVPITFRRP
jgi:TonB family protein